MLDPKEFMSLWPHFQEKIQKMIADLGGGSMAIIQQDGSLEFRDEGVSQGTARALNVTGDGVSVSVSGEVATLSVTGTAELEFRDEGFSRGSAPIMNVTGSGASVSVTGGVATLNVPGGGAGAFTDLTDAPSSYSGQGGKVVKVNTGETGLEFGTASGGSPLTVKEGVGTPSVANVTEIRLPNGTLTDNGSGAVTYTPPIDPVNSVYLNRSFI